MNQQELIVNNLELPKIITNVILKEYRYYKYRQNREDLISVGNLSLVEAAQNYKEDEHNTFQTYASRRIEGDIRKYIRENLSDLGHHIHIDSISISQEEHEEDDYYLLDLGEELIGALEPKDESEKGVYYDVILGEESIRSHALKTGQSKSQIARLKKKVLFDLQNNYKKYIGE